MKDTRPEAKPPRGPVIPFRDTWLGRMWVTSIVGLCPTTYNPPSGDGVAVAAVGYSVSVPFAGVGETKSLILIAELDHP